jgi:hypothetical protein
MKMAAGKSIQEERGLETRQRPHFPAKKHRRCFLRTSGSLGEVDHHLPQNPNALALAMQKRPRRKPGA